MILKVNGVVDRIVDGKAVILIESHSQEAVVNLSEFDANLNEQDWLNIEVDKGWNVVSIEVNHQLIEGRKEIIKGVMNKLQIRKGSKYKK